MTTSCFFSASIRFIKPLFSAKLRNIFQWAGPFAERIGPFAEKGPGRECLLKTRKATCMLAIVVFKEEALWKDLNKLRTDGPNATYAPSCMMQGWRQAALLPRVAWNPLTIGAITTGRRTAL